ncbi:MAG: hypothetical protein DRJ69_06255 [Thermoprotei archaeon]|nr:MAG: hypothetical protein DRJ69_06255 [Thermoprotei archaeon]
MEYSIKYFRIAARFLGVARMDLHEIAEILRSLGYTTIAPLPPKGFKVSMSGSGSIASKGNVNVDVNSDRMVIGVSSPELEGCISEFVMVEKAITSRIEALKDVYFYELLAEVEVKSDVEPMEFMKNISSRNAIVEELSRALGEPLFVFGYRLAREGSSPEESEWVDVEVLPSLARPHSSLYIAIVYRSREREKVLEKGRNIRNLVNAVRKLIASGR